MQLLIPSILIASAGQNLFFDENTLLFIIVGESSWGGFFEIVDEMLLVTASRCLVKGTGWPTSYIISESVACLCRIRWIDSVIKELLAFSRLKI